MAEKFKPLKDVYGFKDELGDYGEVNLESNATGASSAKAGPRKK